MWDGGGRVRGVDGVVVGRGAEVGREACSTGDELWDYLGGTKGGLLWAGVAALGGEAALEAPARALGRALGLANWLMALENLRARG